MTGILVLCIDEGNGGAIGCYCGEGGLVLLFTNHWESSLWTGAGQCGLAKTWRSGATMFLSLGYLGSAELVETMGFTLDY